MIEATGLRFGYLRGRPVLDGWSASIVAGELVAITGPSGSGKSTLLYILGALVRPWSGALSLGGISVSGLGDRARSDVRAALVGFVFQDALLDPRRSVLDNIVEATAYRGDDRRTAVLRALALLERFGVDVEPGRQATDLSGGQGQRVALCRALLTDPAVILADEPTGNLDRANAEVVEAALRERAHAGASVVLATHDERLAATCDRVLAL